MKTLHDDPNSRLSIKFPRRNALHPHGTAWMEWWAMGRCGAEKRSRGPPRAAPLLWTGRLLDSHTRMLSPDSVDLLLIFKSLGLLPSRWRAHFQRFNWPTVNGSFRIITIIVWRCSRKRNNHERLTASRHHHGINNYFRISFTIRHFMEYCTKLG